MRLILPISCVLILTGCASSVEAQQPIINGFGQTITEDGAIYVGEHMNGEFHGMGQLTLSNGSYFVGMMKHNKVDYGRMYFTNGDVRTINQ